MFSCFKLVKHLPADPWLPGSMLSDVSCILSLSLTYCEAWKCKHWERLVIFHFNFGKELRFDAGYTTLPDASNSLWGPWWQSEGSRVWIAICWFVVFCSHPWHKETEIQHKLIMLYYTILPWSFIDIWHKNIETQFGTRKFWKGKWAHQIKQKTMGYRTTFHCRLSKLFKSRDNFELFDSEYILQVNTQAWTCHCVTPENPQSRWPRTSQWWWKTWKLY